MTNQHIFVPHRVASRCDSPLRTMQSEAQGWLYQPLRSLEEAQRDPQGVVILEGDHGGQIFVVCPARVVRCSAEALEQLLRDIDARTWNEPEGAAVYYERYPAGACVPGGMGGGLVTSEIWVHAELAEIAEAIKEVIEGRRQQLASKTSTGAAPE